MASRHKPDHAPARSVVLLTGVLAASVALLPTAHADTAPATLTIDAPDRYLPRGLNLESAGGTGDLGRLERDGSEDFTGYRWSPTSGVPLAVGKDPADPAAERIGGLASDVVGVYTPADRSVELKDMKAGTSLRFTLPEGQTYQGTYGETVLTATWAADGSVESLHLLRPRDDGELKDTPVTGKDGVKPASYKVLGGDAGTLAIWVSGDPTGQVGLVDTVSGRITGVLKGTWGSGYTQVAVGETYVAWFDPAYGDQKAHLLRRDALDGAETTVDVVSSYDQRAYIALVGDWVVSLRQTASFRNSDAPKDRGEPLLAAPVGGGSPVRTLLPHARLGGAYGLNPTPDGGVLVAGGASAGDWGVRKVAARDDGTLAVSTVRSVAPKAGTYGAVTLAAGDLATSEPDTNYLPSLYKRHIDLGALSAGERSLVAQPPLSTDGTGGSAGGGAVALGDGAFVHPAGSGIDVRSAQDDAVSIAVPGGGQVVDASGRYVVFGYGYMSGFGSYQQYVVDREKPGSDKVLLTRPASAAAVWGSSFWTPGDTKGTVRSTDLKSGATESFALGKECTPTDLQAVGRWVYWTCAAAGDPAGSGVWDRETGRMIDVPADGELGDGYVVVHDEGAGELRLLDFHTADGVQTRVLAAELPGYLSHGAYAVDRFGGGVAYLPERGKPGAMRVAASGVPTSALTAVEAHAGYADGRWTGSWQLSKPAAPGAYVVVKDGSGATVRTLPAVQRGAALHVVWDGAVDDGTYSWELVAAPGDGQGAELRLNGGV
ncbi:hypothetical protein DI272_21860 [Streptomyces sp. Act143]|uniref:hypothetical protein n=1 Tax=Streptomyces sp. Act143 TaxID=2200760 RepID=UPI000D6793DD|nr:hypothetical protein [Streptomyces sp. Act143]PWI16518.1 hypothetical protein DI272_21860 [Streptomyces sp. Act143]